MSHKKSVDDYLDPQLKESLKKLGLVPPQTLEDYERLEEELKKSPLKKPASLEDPFAFIENEPKSRTAKLATDADSEYQQNLAQAAREGKSIADHIKKKMEEDKKKSGDTDGE